MSFFLLFNLQGDCVVGESGTPNSLSRWISVRMALMTQKFGFSSNENLQFASVKCQLKIEATQARVTRERVIINC